MIDKLKRLLKREWWANIYLPPPSGSGYQPCAPSNLRLPPPGAHHGPVPLAERAKDGDSLSNTKTDVLEINGLINRVLERSVSNAREFYLARINDLEIRGGVLANTVERSDVLAILGVQHIHRGKYVDDQRMDECGICGRNLRNEVHF